MTRRTFAAGLAFAAAGRAQLSKTMQRGQDLIQECISALGGHAFLNMQDRLEVGRAYSFHREKLSGLAVTRLYTRYPEPPNPVPESYFGILERQVLGKKEEDTILFIPEGGYEVTFRGVRPLPDATVDRHKESVLANILYILRQRLHEPGLAFESKGIDVVENQRVETVAVYDNADRDITVYLGANSHLPVLQRYMRYDPMYKEKIEELTRFSKYENTGDGAMWPLETYREHDGEKISQMFSEKVTTGNNFEGKLFTLPQGMQMLPKEKNSF
jgi:hypothetical protein